MKKRGKQAKVPHIAQNRNKVKRGSHGFIEYKGDLISVIHQCTTVVLRKSQLYSANIRRLVKPLKSQPLSVKSLY